MVVSDPIPVHATPAQTAWVDDSGLRDSETLLGNSTMNECQLTLAAMLETILVNKYKLS